MKIAFFSDCYLDLTGGIVTSINAEKAALESRGHTVYIFSSSFPKSKKQREELAQNHIFPVKSCRIFGRGVVPIARRPRVIERELIKSHPELKDFDIFYVHYEAGCSIAGLRLAKMFHIPSVQVMHGREDVGEENIIPYGLRTFVAANLNWFHSWYLPHQVKVSKDDYLAPTIARAKMWTLMVNHANSADLVITPSEHFCDKLVYYGVTKPIVPLHHGVSDRLVDEKTTPKSIKKGQPLEIIWHSRLSREKRLLPFLRALAKIPSKSYHLSIYGSGPDEPEARAYAKLHRLSTTFYGNVDFTEIWQALKKSHLDLLVSYDFDTFGMTLIEAEAAGVPVFIVDPDMTEIVPAGSFVLSSGPSSAQMAAALNILLDHPDEISKMSAKMLESRDQIRISAKIDRLEQLFHNLESQKSHKNH
ncbi:glycosyltransferase [Candidatus Saccharibacteria bacterium]|nr:glycosyltransferase [Candidatus Saccharibacteria bacterium]